MSGAWALVWSLTIWFLIENKWKLHCLGFGLGYSFSIWFLIETNTKLHCLGLGLRLITYYLISDWKQMKNGSSGVWPWVFIVCLISIRNQCKIALMGSLVGGRYLANITNSIPMFIMFIITILLHISVWSSHICWYD